MTWLLDRMGAGSSGLVRASPRQHSDTSHQDVTSANTRPDAWADLVRLKILRIPTQANRSPFAEALRCAGSQVEGRLGCSYQRTNTVYL